MPDQRSRARRGFFLILVLVVVAVATMAAYSFTDLMIAYDEAAYLNHDRGQADLLVESGVEAVRVVLAQPPASRLQSGGVYQNPQLFQAVNVVPGTDASDRGNFTILAPALDELGQMAGVRYGLQNESARLNLNVLPALESGGGVLNAASEAAAASGLAAEGLIAAGLPTDEQSGTGDINIARSLLLALPGMTEEIADNILDFVDEDDEPRDYGAESEYYLSLPSPYEPKNGPLDSVEELLLVKGVTPWLLFGADANRNGVIDASEQMMGQTAGTGTASLGWAAYLTVHSLENNKRSDGTPRIDVNGDDLQTLYGELSEALGNDDWASFIVAYRVHGKPPAGGGASGSEGSGGGQGGDAGSDGGEGRGGAGGEESERGAESEGRGGRGGGGGEESGGARSPIPWTVDALDLDDLSGGAGVRLTQLLDLVGAELTIGEGDESQTFTSPFTESPLEMVTYIPALMANLTTQDFQTMPGRLNINECPAELIRGIPLLTSEAAEAIIEARAEASESENRQYETWPLVEGLVTLQEMRSLMPIFTAGGDVYRAQVVGYFEGKNAASRAEVIIDATSVNPKVAYWRDLSHLGRGFDVAVLGIRAPDAFQATMQASGN